MGFDWESTLDAEGEGIQDAWENLVADAPDEPSVAYPPRPEAPAQEREPMTPEERLRNEEILRHIEGLNDDEPPFPYSEGEAAADSEGSPFSDRP